MIDQYRNKRVAIFDIGKTRSKLVVLDADGGHSRESVVSSETLANGPYLQLDTDRTWQWMLQALRDSGVAADITDCVVVTHGAAFALLDGDELAVPVMDYEFDDFDAVNPAYERVRDTFGATNSPALPAGLNAGLQIFYVQQTLPDDFSRVTAIVPYPQFWASRLCGKIATEFTSLGCHSDLWRPAARQYSSLVGKQGWVDLMPPLRSAWEVLGTVLPDVAVATGLNPGCRILCGIHDSNASYLRHLSAEQDRFCIVSTGTWVVCMAGAHSLDCLEPERDMLANVDVFANPVPCARFMGGREFSILTGGTDGAAEATLADASEVIEDRRMALPSFTESGGPFSELSGEVLNPSRDAAAQCAMASLYCALMTDVCLDNLGASGDLILEGRYVSDPIFVEALSQFRPEQPLRVSADATGTIQGAARLLVWPEEPPVVLPAYLAKTPAAPYLEYRDRWRRRLS